MPERLALLFLLEAVATGRAHSEAGMVRLLGRDASFCSRAVDRLVKRGWLRKQPKRRPDDTRFEVKITRKGTGIYREIQAGFVERVNRKLSAAPSRPKKLAPVLKHVALFSQMLFGTTAPGDMIKQAENDMIQQPLAWLEAGGPLKSAKPNRRRKQATPGPTDLTSAAAAPQASRAE